MMNISTTQNTVQPVVEQIEEEWAAQHCECDWQPNVEHIEDEWAAQHCECDGI